MAYKLKPNESPGENFVRVACGQLGRAVAEIDDPALSDDVIIHQVRKRCKKLRALARLYRKPLGRGYKSLNRHCRDLANRLAAGRDVKAMIDAYDDVMESVAPEDKRRDFASIRRHFTPQRQGLEADAASAGVLLAQTRQGLLDGMDVVRTMRFKERPADPAKAALPGLRGAYKRSRKAMAKAYVSGRGEDFHAWRKGAKAHWYHCRLLAGCWPRSMERRACIAADLGELLGKDHDLFVLSQSIRRMPDTAAPEHMPAFADLILRRQQALRRAATGPGALLFLEKPANAIRRMRTDELFEPVLPSGGA